MSAGGTDADLLERIEAYCDAVPRPAADVEEHGALTLFVSRIPWRFYAGRGSASPRTSAPTTSRPYARASASSGVREAFEWVHETTPSLAGARAAAGLEVTRVPLLALDAGALAPRRRPTASTVRMLAPDDPALAARPGGRRAGVRRARRGARRRAGPAERDRAVAARAATSGSCASGCAAA